jgi:hypothetical protein
MCETPLIESGTEALVLPTKALVLRFQLLETPVLRFQLLQPTEKVREFARGDRDWFLIGIRSEKDSRVPR